MTGLQGHQEKTPTYRVVEEVALELSMSCVTVRSYSAKVKYSHMNSRKCFRHFFYCDVHIRLDILLTDMIYEE